MKDNYNDNIKTPKTKDIIKPTLYSKIIDLRNIQLELKCESEVKEFNKSEVENIKLDVKEELATMIFHRKMLFTYFMLSTNNDNNILQSSLINSLFRDIALSNPSPLNYFMYDGDYAFDFADCTSSNQKLQHFAKDCVSYAKEHPEKVDQLTFSVIPGFFEYFWSTDINLKFRDFISFALNEDKDIATKFSRVIYASTELFYSVFDLFITNEDQIPNFISESFLQKNDLPDIDICTDIFNLKANSQENRKKKHLSTTLCSSKISEIIDLSNEYFFFTESDIEIISFLINSDNQVLQTKSSNDDYYVYRFEPIKNEQYNKPISSSTRPTSLLNKNYQLPTDNFAKSTSYRGSLSEKPKDDPSNFSMIYSESFNMSYLRKLLVMFPTIQIIAPNHIDDIRVSTILANQVCLARDEDRLLFEKQIENLKKIEKEEGNELEWNITQITRRLREGFNERRSNFQKDISEIAKVQDYLTKIENLTAKIQKDSDFFRQNIQLNIIQNWEKTGEFSTSAKNFQKMPKFSKLQKDHTKMKANYTNIWENILKDFNSWLKTNGYAIKFQIRLLHDKFLSFYTFSDYLKEKDVTKKESEFCQLIQKQKNEIRQYCNSGHKGQVSKEDFLSNEFFMEKLKKLFNTAVNEQTPIKQIFVFIDLFKLINSVFAQIFNDLNNDDIVKFFVLFISSLDKIHGRLRSSFDYISTFLWFDNQNKFNEDIFDDDWTNVSTTFNYIASSISIIENLEKNPEKYK